MTFGELMNIALQLYDQFKSDPCQGCGNAERVPTGHTEKPPYRKIFLIRRRSSYYPNKSECVPVRARVSTRTFSSTRYTSSQSG